MKTVKTKNTINLLLEFRRSFCYPPGQWSWRVKQVVRPGHCPGGNGSPTSSVCQGVLAESRHWVETGAGLFIVLLEANPGERGRWD